MNIDAPVSTLFKLGRNGLPIQTGDIGIEVEAEGWDLPVRIAGGRWAVKNDGSLRAPEGGACYEYITNGAIPYADVPAVLNELATPLGKAKLRWSNRTSVHIHVNVSDMSYRDTINFMALYTTFEEVLTEYAGGLKRSGNLFCVRATDAEECIDAIVRSLSSGTIDGFYDDNLHYAGMNVNSVTQRGSIEFRSMGGNIDVPFIQSWIDVLYQLREKAKTYNDPRDVVMGLSTMGPIHFMMTHFPERVFLQCRQQPELFPRLFDGVRLAQELAYACEWPERKPYKAAKAAPKPEVNPYMNLGDMIMHDVHVDAPMLGRGIRVEAADMIRPARRPVRRRV